MQNFITIATEQLNEAETAQDVEATRLEMEKNTRSRAMQRIIFTTAIDHKKKDDIVVPITGLNKILDVQLISLVKHGGAYYDKGILEREPTIKGTTVTFTLAGDFAANSDIKFDVIGTN